MYNAYSNEAAVKAANHQDIIHDDLFFAGLPAAEPEALRELWPKRRWANHKKKIPYNPRTGSKARSNDPNTCVYFREVSAAQDEYDGVEYLLGEGICGVDLDHCIHPKTGTIDKEAYQVIDMLDSYAELSPSGTGIHILVKGEMPFTGRQGSRNASLQIEMYSEQRFLTITGLAINDLPIADRTEQIKELADQYFPSTDISKESGTASAPLDPDNSQKMILSALDAIDPADCDYMQWIRIGVGLKEAGLGADIWDEWSSRDPDKYKPGECSKKWDTFKEPGQNSNGSGIIIELAKENGWQIGDAFDEDEKEEYFRSKALSELQQMQHLTQTPVADPVTEEDEQDEADEPHIDISCLSGSPHFGSEYASMEIEKPDYFIDGLVPVGGIILAGPPKIGKSLIALDMAYCVAGKEDYLGRKTKKAPVVYYALEDYDYRIKERILIQGRQDKDRYDTPVIVTEAKRLNDGLNDEIKRFLELNGESLVIIDTFQCVRPSNQSGTAEYKQDYPLISALSKLAREYNSTILLIHHTKKTPDESNPFNMINGSVALQGATDAMMVITRNAKQRSTGNATLHATGRDIGTDEIELIFNKDNLTWTEAAVTKENSRRDCYDLDPVMITIRTIMEEIEADDNLVDKEFVVTMSDLLLEAKNRTGQCGEMTALQCGAVVRKYIDLLEEDGIAVDIPQGNIRTKGKSGRYFKFRLIG